MERSFSEKHQILVGAAVILALAYMIVYGYVSDRPGGALNGSYSVEAEFDSVAGISMGSPVLMAGLQIGKVSDVRLDASRNTAVLRMSIREGIEIPYDSVAKILTQGFMGSKYIKVSPGGAFEMLQDGEEFEYVQDSILFQELLEKVIATAEAKQAAEREKLQQSGDDTPTGGSE